MMVMVCAPLVWPLAMSARAIGVWNTSTHATIADVEAHAIVYWMTGAQAGVAVNASLTNFKYDGELIIDTKYTQVELEAAIKAGKCMFHNVNGVTRVLEDINTLLTLSDTKGEVFQSNQTMRVCDQIANDVAVLFNTVKVNKGAKTYTGGSLASFVYRNTYTVMQVNGSRVVIGQGGVVTAAMNIKDLTLVG